MVEFNEEKHKYYLSDTKDELISSTTLIGKYKPSFDVDSNAARIASREGVTKEFIVELWNKEKNDACDYGTFIHKVMENYIKQGIRDEQYADLYSSFDKVKNTLNFSSRAIHSEVQVYSKEYMVAGTADLLLENDKYFYILDFKTNKKFNYTNNFHDFFNKPLNHLPVCEFNTYCLQLSLYAFLYKAMTGKKCKGLTVLFLENNKWIPINMNYMEKEIIELLLDYKNPS